MKLYGFPTPRNVTVWAMIEHLALDVERVTVDLMRGEQKSAEYLALNPNGLTPTLVDGDFVLWEHAAILQYLAESTGSTLAPSTPGDRANATRWVSWTQMHFVPGADVLGFEHLAKPAMGLGLPDPAEVKRGQALLTDCVSVIDRYLSKSTYMLGDALSFVDFFFAGGIAHWQKCEMLLEDAPHLLKWFGGMEGLPAWKQQFGQAGHIGS